MIAIIRNDKKKKGKIWGKNSKNEDERKKVRTDSSHSYITEYRQQYQNSQIFR